MDGRAVPDHRQLACDLALERGEELHHLLALDGTVEEAEAKRHQLSPAIADTWLQLKLCWITGVCPHLARVLVNGHLSDRPQSSMKTLVLPSRRKIFL